MIIKNFDLKKNLNKNVNLFLLYGPNNGLIEDSINDVLKPNFSKNIYNYDENEVLSNTDNFNETIFNKSFFENDKLIIISRATDKMRQTFPSLPSRSPLTRWELVRQLTL